ncbi:MAG: CCA tRNA nucleotidyltransferase [Candidatus Omnitrophica bacterium]|nr:CCA tRNA nucleotidyltransferase [Candidatus Omnitrophota bacterium]
MELSQGIAQTAFTIAKRLKDQGHTAYFAGGCVRDFLMKKSPQDFDIATTATPDQVEKIFAKTIPVGKQFGVMLVVEGGKNFEVATFRREGGYQDGRHPSHVEFSAPEQDAVRRDFTVNGMFYDPFNQKVLDYVGGREDIQKKVIRAIGDPVQRFEEDKLRLLRAIRFAAFLDYEIESATWRALCQKAHEIHSVSPERIRDEMIKIFTRPGAARGYDLLSESGLMKEILPEIEVMKKVEQSADYHPEGDVFVHTKLLLEKLKNPSTALAFGALFHDVGKPVTYAIREGRITFYEHAPLGAKMTQAILKRLRFPNDEIAAICSCVENHMKFADVQKMRSGKLKQFVARPTFNEELELHRIDCLSSHGKLDNYYFLKEKLKEYEHEELKPKPWVNGHDLIDLGMKPGPKMKTLLEELYELQLEGAFKDRAEALDAAKKRVAL